MGASIIESDGIKVKVSCNKRSKRIRLSILNDGTVLLSRPFYVTEKRALSFLDEHADWIKKKLTERTKNTDTNISVYDPDHYLGYKEKARRVVEDKVDQWSNFYGIGFNKISIRNQKRRWGSCSSVGNLNFNYKIFFLKEELQDYLVVHELCHLKYMDHSKAFWKEVAKAVPDYKERAKLLKKGVDIT
ncbi:MAG: M48 family metallopeptidase [Patescibacteria group bacterium]